MVEIDEKVIKAAKQYMPNYCKEAFQSRIAHIVIENANDFLNGKHGFDAIIYDLTMHPEAITNVDRTVFLDQVFSRINNNLIKRRSGQHAMLCQV